MKRSRFATEVDRSAPPRLGTTLGDLLAMEQADIRSLLPDADSRMQTEAFWREVWGLA